MDKAKEILNYLLSKKNINSILILVIILVFVYFALAKFIVPKIEEVKQLYSDIDTNKARLEGLIQQKKTRELEEKKSLVKFDDVPVVLYKPTNSGLPVDSSSLDFVSTVIKMIEKTDNTIIDISYKIDPLSENDKITLPSTVAVVQLAMTLNGTYMTLQDFIYTLYDYDYLATIKAIKVVPLKENKNMLEINLVLWLYVKR